MFGKSEFQWRNIAMPPPEVFRNAVWAIRILFSAIVRIRVHRWNGKRSADRFNKEQSYA